MSIVRRYIVPTLVFVAVLGCWHGVVAALKVPTYLFPGPTDVFRSLVENRLALFVATCITLFEAAGGLLVALIITTAFGFCFAVSPFAERSMAPFLVGLQSIPILALAPLLTLWFGVDAGSKVAASCLICFFPLLAGWSSGIRSVDPEERDYFKTLGASRWQVTWHLVLPRSLPYFFAGLKVAAPLSIVGAIVGEFVGARNGIGFLTLTHSYYARTSDMFACMVVASLLGVAANYTARWLERRTLFWHGAEMGWKGTVS